MPVPRRSPPEVHLLGSLRAILHANYPSTVFKCSLHALREAKVIAPVAKDYDAGWIVTGFGDAVMDTLSAWHDLVDARLLKAISEKEKIALLGKTKTYRLGYARTAAGLFGKRLMFETGRSGEGEHVARLIAGQKLPWKRHGNERSVSAMDRGLAEAYLARIGLSLTPPATKP